MSVQSALYYWVVCDCCGQRADYGDYSAWAEESTALEYGEASFERVGDEDLCAECWCWPEDLPGYEEATWKGSDDPVRRHAKHPEAVP